MNDERWPAAIDQLLAENGLADGEALSALDHALIKLGLACSVTAMNQQTIDTAIDQAFAVGATPIQAQEMVSVVAGLGVHSLMVSATSILESAMRNGFDIAGPFNDDEQRLWDAKIGTDPFWTSMEQELPGFLHAMLRLSPDQFIAFFDFCAVPWKTRSVSARVKELAAMACDATPSHRFLPGFRLHFFNAVNLGAGRKAVKECLALAGGID